MHSSISYAYVHPLCVTVTSVTLVELGSLPNAAILLLLSRIFFLTVTLSYYYHLGRRAKKIWETRTHQYETPGARELGDGLLDWSLHQRLEQFITSTCSSGVMPYSKDNAKTHAFVLIWSLFITQEYALTKQLFYFFYGKCFHSYTVNSIFLLDCAVTV